MLLRGWSLRRDEPRRRDRELDLQGGTFKYTGLLASAPALTILGLLAVLVWSIPAMSADYHVVEGLSDLIDAGLVQGVLYEVKSGKEATVYCCIAGPNLPRRLALDVDWPEDTVAVKVYRDIATRAFRNSAVYQAGRVHLARDGRAKRAAQNRSAFGVDMEQALWIDQEWSIMNRLFDAGLDVVQPLARGERSLVMPFVGNRDGPAPMLHEVGLLRQTAGMVVDRLLWNIEMMLDLHVVHGDLSPFNAMWIDERAIIIDLPQAIDPRLNPAALSLLSRDVQNICDWAKRFGIVRDAPVITNDLWARFTMGELG